jgi:7,8-dihydropterin-6-yl-methyl-4-(beta-D-ribofuranosyl)aminobenzene 5'-phosphate synthase
MELTVLVDNNTFIDHYFFGEPALSFFIEEDGKRILFDTGYSDIFLKNAEKLRIDLTNLDYVVLSHGHADHTWGLTHLIKLFSEAKLENMRVNIPTVIGHPLVFNTKLDFTGEIGSIISHDKIKSHFPTRLTNEPLWLTDRLVFLGEIKRTIGFEGTDPMGKVVTDKGIINDYLMDDTAIAYKSAKGLVIITGCSHSGICNIVEYAKKVCQEDRVTDIIGGFHLQNPTKIQLENTVDFIEKLEPATLHACHCTDLRSKIALSSAAPLEEVGVGLQLFY